jgi:hypothetical protein
VGLDGFDDFVLTAVVPSCFQSLMRPDTDLDDAWTHLMVAEVAGVLIASFHASGPPFLEFLQGTYFPQVEMPAEASAAIVDMIQAEDKKALGKGLTEIAKALR